MRRLSWLLLAAVVGFVTPAAAQTTQATAEKSFGVQVGFGMAYGTPPKGGTKKNEATFNVGGVAILPLSDNWAFQAEVKYDKRKITIGGVPTEVGYISVPVLLRNKFRGIYLVQGLSFNNVAHASVFDVDFKKALTSPDIAAVVGFGKRGSKFGVEGRWETGFRSFQKDVSASGVHMRSLTAVATIYLK